MLREKNIRTRHVVYLLKNKLERRINELENETEELKYNNDKLGNRIIDLESNNSELMDSYEKLSNDYDNLTSEIDTLYLQLEELENTLKTEYELPPLDFIG